MWRGGSYRVRIDWCVVVISTVMRFCGEDCVTLAANEYLLVEVDSSHLMCGIWKDSDSGAAPRRNSRPAEPPDAHNPIQ